MRLIKLPKVIKKIDRKKSWIYEQMAKGLFPKSIKLGNTASNVWLESEIDEWIKERVEISRRGQQHA